MTLQLLHSEFPYIWGNFDFLFYQCIHASENWPSFLLNLGRDAAELRQQIWGGGGGVRDPDPG